MGGKVWSETEERHFWRVAVAQSPKRCGIDQAKAERSWEELAREMQVVMGTRARRQYSGTMLFEHYFQNVESQRRSPYAGIFVREYLAKRDRNRIMREHRSAQHTASDRRRIKLAVRVEANTTNNNNNNNNNNKDDGDCVRTAAEIRHRGPYAYPTPPVREGSDARSPFVREESLFVPERSQSTRESSSSSSTTVVVGEGEGEGERGGQRERS